MRFTLTVPDVVDSTDSFYCRSRRKTLFLANCLEDYVDANALEKKLSACFRCPIGMVNRRNYAGEPDLDDDA